MSNTLMCVFVCVPAVWFPLIGSASREFFKTSITQTQATSAVKLNIFFFSTNNPSPTIQSQTGHHTLDSTNGLFGLMGEVGPWVRESRESWRYMLSW